MIAIQKSLYGSGRQALKFKGLVWNFATFARLPFGQFSVENSQDDWVVFYSVTFQLTSG